MCFIPVEFSLVNLTIRTTDERKPVQLAPAPAPEHKFQSLVFPDGKINGDNFDVGNLAHQLEVIPIAGAYQTKAVGTTGQLLE